MKRILITCVLALAFFYWETPRNNVSAPVDNEEHIQEQGLDAFIEAAYEAQRSDVQVQGSGTVIQLLRDDNKGSRHQKFIVRLASGHTLLIAHNIDLAPRVDAISIGDRIHFYGEYEWTNKGGVVHWTHHDPNARHVDGWLMHKGRQYQ